MTDLALSLVPLGKTVLRVTLICAGGAPLGLPEVFALSLTEERALATLRAIFASPISFLDTGRSYGDCERRIGVIIREMGGLPPGFVLASKVDRDMQTGDFSGAQMRRSLEQSLEILHVDSLPLVYLHDPEHTTFEEAMAPGGPVEVLQQLKAEGLCDHIGVAGGPIDMMIRYVETGLFEAAISHNRYTLLNIEADPLWDACVRHGVAALNAAPYGSGMLAKGPRAYPRYGYGQASSEYVQRALQIQAACNRYGVPLGAVALQFSFRNPRITSTIVGMSNPERIEETLQFYHCPIPIALWEEVEVLRKKEE